MLYPIISTIRKFILALTIYLIFNGWGIFAVSKSELLYMYANLTTFSLWVIFLMGAVILSPIGRIFCTLCPIGEVNYIFSKIGLKKKSNFNLSWLQGVSLIVIFVLVIVFHISRHPHYTALLILITLIVAVIFGLLFNGNSFCLLLCPANAFLKFYTRYSFLDINCSKKAMIKTPCMVFINPCNHKRGQCHLCLRCFHKSEGIGFKFSNSFDNNQQSLSNSDFFVFSVLFGLTFMAFIRVVREFREWYVYPPYLICEFLNLNETYLIYLIILTGVLIYPFVFILLISIFKKIFLKNPFIEIIKSTTEDLILPTFSIHLILAFIKINSRIGFLPFIFKDPQGREMISLYQLGKIDIPPDLIPIQFSKYLILLIPIMALFASFHYLKKKFINKKIFIIHLLPIFIFTLFIEICIIIWLFRGFL
jgi:hypothetical protein